MKSQERDGFCRAPNRPEITQDQFQVTYSNLDFAEWDQAYPANRLLASATLDRLRHNAYCLVLDGESFRAPRLAPGGVKARVATTPKTAQA